jgi:putative lumazine-binding protein
MKRSPSKCALAASGALASVIALGACGEAVSTGKFSGESRTVAEAVAGFQKDVSPANEKKLCANDLAATLVSRLAAAGGCQAVLSGQLKQVDTPTLEVESISIVGASAQARVKSTWSGKSKTSTLSLVKEGGRWKISGSGQ